MTDLCQQKHTLMNRGVVHIFIYHTQSKEYCHIFFSIITHPDHSHCTKAEMLNFHCIILYLKKSAEKEEEWTNSLKISRDTFFCWQSWWKKLLWCAVSDICYPAKAVVRHPRCLVWRAFLQQMAFIACFSLVMHQNHTDAYAQSKLSCFWSVCMAVCFSSAPVILTQAPVSYKKIKEIKRLEIALVL